MPPLLWSFREVPATRRWEKNRLGRAQEGARGDSRG
jgi:hypothetical protein